MSTTENQEKESFALSTKNYKLMLIGIAVVILGFILMIGGGTEDPMEFSEDIFSFRRITLAPIVVVIGYVVIFYSIIKKNTSSQAEA
ncbi:MAG TPA: DUF3098 domain-containing protein [Cryomorphaceae bacterium]|nr:DUF3098 domain-containing protein [Cryomorphaceae bacterium]